MNAESFLSSTTEVAIGIAGFAGIVAAIRHRDLNAWADEERLLLRMLLIASGMSILFSWLPAVLNEADVRADTTWRLSSLGMLVWLLSTAVYRSRQIKQLDQDQLGPRVAVVWNAAILLLQGANVYLALTWPYMLGIVGILANAFMFFLVLLLGRSSGS